MSASVLVYVSGPDPKGVKVQQSTFHATENGTATFSATGVLWHRKEHGVVILAPVSLLLPFLRRRNPLQLAQEKPELMPMARISCRIDKAAHAAQLRGSFELPDCCAAVRYLCSDGDWRWEWQLLQRSQQGSDRVNAMIAVLTCEAGNNDHSICCAIDRISDRQPVASERLTCEGCPFGCLASEHFSAFLTAGSVACVPSPGASVFLADMSAVPGMEGAPVMGEGGTLLGMLAPPLSSTKFDAQVPVVIAASALQKAYKVWEQHGGLRHATQSSGVTGTLKTLGTQFAALSAAPTSASIQPKMPSALRAASEAVVAVRAGASWASGVMISDGLVLTVAHAFDQLAADASNQSHQEAMVSVAGSGWQRAELVHVFPEGLDLAVLRTTNLNLNVKAAQLSPAPVVRGEEVYVVGHGLFNPRLGLGPLCTRGILSRTIGEPGATSNEALMVITDAAVFPGASGGGLFSSDGRLLGIVTSNTRHAASGRSFPRLSYAVASGALRPLWRLLEPHGAQAPAEKLAAVRAVGDALSAAWPLKTSPGLISDAPERLHGRERLARLVEGSGLQVSESKL